MIPEARSFILLLCTVGMSAWLALMLAFGLIILLRKILAWVAQWT